LTILLWLAACAPATLRPAHSLGKLEGAGSVAAFWQPGEALYTLECDYFADSCPGFAAPVQMEFRVGLGRGWEIGVRGLTPPKGVDVKWSVLDERRHETPLSVALDAEVNVDLALRPILRGQVLLSSNRLLGDDLAIRPALNVGYWKEPTLDDADAHGIGGLAGVFVPVRFLDEQSIAPYVATSYYLPWGRPGVVILWAGVDLGPWLEWTGLDEKELGD